MYAQNLIKLDAFFIFNFNSEVIMKHIILLITFIAFTFLNVGAEKWHKLDDGTVIYIESEHKVNRYILYKIHKYYSR